jgi:tetratricopeptide (TPR) repeat protein
MTAAANSTTNALAGRRVVLLGKLGGVNRREAQAIVRDHGGIVVAAGADEQERATIDLVVIGADELPVDDHDDIVDDALRDAAAAGRVEIITETQLWQRLGLVEEESDVHRLYTPAMLADLLGVSIATVRRWHRRGLIVPVREVQRLPYFDYQEVATARRLAQLLAAGASPAHIEKKLGELARYVPEVERPLAQLSVIVEGKHFLLRQGEGLIEPGGQLRFDFDALDPSDGAEASATPNFSSATADVVSLEDWRAMLDQPSTPDEMIALAIELEDDDRLEAAAEMYRAALLAFGPDAEIDFLLAELLYRLGDVTAARERYYAAIELDDDYVEARANLGCVLVETGQPELAVKAFEGALAHHDEYPDVHYHLARTLEDLGNHEEARVHWATFVELAPASPWAEEARERL